MGSISVACYRPKPGKEDALAALVRGHVDELRELGLATERASIIMRTADGVFVEVFEWVSKEAIERAHSHPDVEAMWKRFGELCTYETAANLAEFKAMFAHFEPVN